MTSRVFEGRLVITYEDSGMAAIGELLETDDQAARSLQKVVNESDGPFVRIQSWSEPADFSDAAFVPDHSWLESLEGKQVRVTVEVLE